MAENINTNQMLKVGTKLNGQYRIERYLASGGFGNTYTAINEFDERVAVKEFFMKDINLRGSDSATVTITHPQNAQMFNEQREKFKKEAKRLRNMQNQHIVKVLSLFEENNTVYYVMDYIDGISLSTRLNHNGAFTEDEVRYILDQMLEALEEIHGKGLFHLDIKPGNIMLDRQSQVRIIDFGASKQISMSGGVTATSQAAFTIGYAPPEQVEGKMDKIGPWTDFYALGATLYRLLTNETPPQFSDILDNGKDAFWFPDNVSQPMCDLIIWMLAPGRNQRPQSVADVRQRLNGSETVPTAPPISSEEPSTLATIIPPQNAASSFTTTPPPAFVEAPIYNAIEETEVIPPVSSIHSKDNKSFEANQQIDVEKHKPSLKLQLIALGVATIILVAANQIGYYIPYWAKFLLPLSMIGLVTGIIAFFIKPKISGVIIDASAITIIAIYLSVTIESMYLSFVDIAFNWIISWFLLTTFLVLLSIFLLARHRGIICEYRGSKGMNIGLLIAGTTLIGIVAILLLIDTEDTLMALMDRFYFVGAYYGM